MAAYLRTRGGSVLPSAIFIGSLTCGAQVSDLLLIGGDELHTRATGLPGVIVLTAIVLLVVVPGTRQARESFVKVAAPPA